MKRHFGINRVWLAIMSIVMMGAMVLGIAATANAAKSKATTIRLVKTEGNVTIKNSKLEEQVQTEEMRLYSGDHQITDSASYAWMSLDDTKAVKLDENSESELRKKWKKLEVMLDSGSIFFNVTVPLAKDETLNIRSSTMITGVRGTCGWIRIMNGGDTRVYLLEGTLECLVTNPMDGESKTITLKPGQFADFIVYDVDQQGEKTLIVPGTFDKDDIEPYVLEELIGDNELIEKIYEQSGIDLRNIQKGDALNKKSKAQEVQAEAKKGIRGKAAKQDGIVSKDPVWDDKGTGDNNSIVYLTMPQTAATVQRFLSDDKVKKVVLLPGEVSQEENTLMVDIAFQTPEGKTLESREGVRVNVEEGRSFLVDGTVDLNDQIENHGTLTVNSANTLRLRKLLRNFGTLENTETGRIVLSEGMESNGVLKTAGIIEAQEGVYGDTLIKINGGSFAITGGQIITAQFKTVLSVASSAEVSLDLNGGVISNDQDGGTTIQVSSDHFKVENMSTDVMGVTDTLLGEAVDLTQYDAATVWRTDGRFHLIALAAVDSYPVIIVQAEHGSIAAPDRVEVGATVPLTVMPDSGYVLESLSVNLHENGQTGAPVGLSGDNTFVMPRSNVIVTGSFKKIDDTQNTTPDDQKPDDGDPIQDGNPDGQDGQDDQNDTYGISVRNVVNGTVTVSTRNAKEKERITISVAPQVGHEFESLSVTTKDGNAVSYQVSGNGYVFDMPAADVTVSAVFRALTYEVTFYDTDGKTVLNKQTLAYGTVPVYGGRTPSRASTTQYDYSFSGWKNIAGTTYRTDMPLPAVTGNESYTAQFNLSLRTYAVTFYDEDGTTQLKQQRFSYGSIPIFGDTAPTKTATPQYAYVFAGWKRDGITYVAGTDLPSVNGDVSYTVVFDSILNVCDVIWQLENGIVLETDYDVPYGTIADYNGAVPTQRGDAHYSYDFDGWTDGTATYGLSDDLPQVTQAVTFTAVFAQKVNKYTVTWKDANGDVLETDEDVPFGTTVSYDDAIPTKSTDYDYSYTFDHWTDGTNNYSASMPQVEGDLTLTAVYATTPIIHVTGVSLDQVELPLILGGTDTGVLVATLAPAGATYQTVTWSSSNDNVAEVVGNGLSATVTAKSNGTATITVTTDDEGKTATCTVRVTTAVDKVALDKESATVILGTTETLTVTIMPDTASNKNVTWSSSVPGVATVAAGSTTGTAVITPVSAGTTQIKATTEDGGHVATCAVTVSGYTVTFMNEGSTVPLETQTNLAYQAPLAYTGATPAKTSSPQYHYLFDGWTDGTTEYRFDGSGVLSLPNVTKNVTYTALYRNELRSYAVTWKNSDGSTMATDMLEFGATPTYKVNGTAVNPTLTSTPQYNFTFKGWLVNGTFVDKADALPTVEGITELQAQYDSETRKYNVTFYDEDKQTVLDGQENVLFDTTITYQGTVPTKMSSQSQNFTFAGWTDADNQPVASLGKVTGEMKFYASYTASTRKYTVTFKNDDGSILTATEYDFNTAAADIVRPTDPTKQTTEAYEYTFTGWTPTITDVTNDAIYTAQYSVRNRVTGLSLNKNTINLVLSMALQVSPYDTLTATIAPANASDLGVIWESSDETICRVEADPNDPSHATVTAVGTGTASITATSAVDDKSATCEVTVTRAVYSVALDKTKLLLVTGGVDETLTATISPSDATNQNVTWETGDESIATVTGDGLTATVHAVGNGVTDVTVTTEDGGKTASIPVTVTTAVNGVSFANATEDFYLGTTGNVLQVTIDPATASNQNVSWESSDETVATVTVDVDDSTKATINPLKMGTTVITVTTADGNKTDTCTVTIKGYQVTFIDHNGTMLTTYYGYGDTPVYPVTTLRYPEGYSSNTHNYTFAGFSDGTKTYNYSIGGGLETFDPITTDTTYTAVYTESPRVFRVNLELNAPADTAAAGPSIAAGKDVTQYTYGTVTVLPDDADVTCPGYHFVGWYKTKTPTASDPVYTEISDTDYGIQEFWAKWEKTYNATMPANLSYGTVTAQKSQYLAPGETVTLAVSPESTYELSYLYYTPDEGGAKTVIEKNEDGTYSFEMPEYDVTISAAFNWLHDLYYSFAADSGTLTLARHQSEDGSLTQLHDGHLLFTDDTTITKIVFAEEVYPKKLDNAFAGCTSLTTVENMDKVHLANDLTDLSGMFKGCTNLTSLDLTGFDTSNVTDMSEMFSGCTNLTDLNLSGFDTANVTTMNGMFSECANIGTLDLSSFDTASVTDMTHMFYDCYCLGTIYVSDGFVTDQVTSSENMFEYCATLTGGYGTRAEYMEGVKYTPLDATNARVDTESQEGYFTKKGETASTKGLYYTIVKEDDDNIVMSIYANKEDGRTEMLGGALYCSGIEYDDGEGNTIYTSQITKVKIMEDIAPNKMIYAFGDMDALQAIEGLDKINTEKVTDMSYVFFGCYSLEGTLDISKWKMQNVTTMEAMFYGCGALTSIKLPAGDYEDLKSMSSMFCECYSLTSISMSGFKTTNLEDMSSMFHGCGELTSIDLSGFNTSNVKTMRSMFLGCEELATIDVGNFDTSNVEDFCFMFDDCKKVTTLSVAGFNTANVRDFYGMFDGCYALKTLDLSRWDTSNAVDFGSMFAGCYALESVDVSKFNTSNVTSMRAMFYNCTSLTELDLSSFDTSKVSDFGSMFYAGSADTKLTTIYVSNTFVMGNTYFDYSMFENRTALKGGAGSEYKADRISSEYAHIDGGQGAEGYFTAKNMASGSYQLCFIKSTSDGGAITASVDGTELSAVSYVPAGKTIEFKVKEGSGYSVRSIHAAKKVGGEEVSVSYTKYQDDYRYYSFVMPEADLAVNVEYVYFNSTLFIDEDQLDLLQDVLNGDEYDTIYIYYSCTLGEDITIPAGKTLFFERDDVLDDRTVTIPVGVTITIEEGATLENYCTLVCEGTIDVKGRFHNYCDHTLKNYGTILIRESGSLVNGDGMDSGKDGRLCNYEGGVIHNSGSLINAYGSVVENGGMIINDHAVLSVEDGFGSFIGNAEITVGTEDDEDSEGDDSDDPADPEDAKKPEDQADQENAEDPDDPTDPEDANKPENPADLEEDGRTDDPVNPEDAGESADTEETSGMDELNHAESLAGTDDLNVTDGLAGTDYLSNAEELAETDALVDGENTEGSDEQGSDEGEKAENLDVNVPSKEDADENENLQDNQKDDREDS